MYNSSHINAVQISAFKRMIYQWFCLDVLSRMERLALAAALEEAAVEIRQTDACAKDVNDAAKNQILD